VTELTLAEMFLGIPVHRALGVTLTITAEGIELRGTVPEAFARADGYPTMHGGAVASLLDSAATFALLAHEMDGWATADLRIDYLRPVLLGDVLVTASALRVGATLARARGELSDSSGKVSAMGFGTFVRERH
jgi:uncharacterized protein (TIGR00369 family)